MAASDHGRGAEPEASCGTDIQKTGFKRKSVYLFQKISYNIRDDSEEKQEMEADFCMRHEVKVTVIEKRLFPELQAAYCADPDSGACPCYNVGDEFLFRRDEERDDFWHIGLDTLVKTSGNPDTVAGGPKLPFCSEAWDAIARYIYTGLQGGSIMKGWMKHENEMITCCSDGTRPVIFKIERLDYEED